MASTYLILHNIRSAENVGSLFRTADAFGVTKIYLTGFTPSPLDRFKRPVSKIAKTALGAELVVPWEFGQVHVCIERLKAEGVRVVALEQDARAVELMAYSRNGDSALILGNEVDGIDASTLEKADDVVHIPMHGAKESLNVAVAGGIALYALTER
ncbi:TrmH family RNA methyltransferase [Patescibacteria group bacterium]|nr:TrmH family RNA methyltransferase [Patescibacteria group bacterium]